MTEPPPAAPPAFVQPGMPPQPPPGPTSNLFRAEKMGPALKAGFDRLEWARGSYGRMVSDYAGRHYGTADPGDGGMKRPVNLLRQYVDTLIPNLLNQRPSMVGRSRIAALRGDAVLVSLALQLIWDDMRLVERMHQLMLDAMLAPFAVAKVGQRVGPDVCKIGERGILRGQPYVARISPDDFAIDPAARTPEEINFQGHRYRVPKSYAMECGIYDADAIAACEPLGRSSNSNSRSGVDTLSGESDRKRYEHLDYIELWDVAIREEDRWLIGTMCSAGDSGSNILPKWVNIDGEPYEWEGDPAGPYEMLTFHRIPDNVPAASPAMAWYDLHEAMDKIYRKMIDQGLRAKKNLAYNRDASDDALTLKDAPDGDAIAVENVDTLKEIETGGVPPENFAFAESLNSMWNAAAGNIQLLSGSGVQSDKATGQQILQANSQTRLGFQRDCVWRFANALNRHLAGYLTSDPLIRLPMPYRLPGGEFIEVVYDAATRRGDSSQMTFEIEMASMVARDPEIELRRKLEGLNAFATMAQLGPIINLQALARQMGRELRWTDFDEIINDQENQMMLMGTIGAPGKGMVAGMGGPGGGGGAPNSRAMMVRGAYGSPAEGAMR